MYNMSIPLCAHKRYSLYTLSKNICISSVDSILSIKKCLEGYVKISKMGNYEVTFTFFFSLRIYFFLLLIVNTLFYHNKKITKICSL